nr:unnamed protein product [Callosobruchus analis]
MENRTVFEAAHKGDFEFVKSQLDENPSLLTQADSNQRLLIHWSVLSGNVKLVTYLIDLGTPINPADDTDSTPLILASSAGRSEIVRMILERCDDVNHKRAKVIQLCSMLLPKDGQRYVNTYWTMELT